MLISTLVSGVGNLVNYLVNANKEATKLRKNLSYDLSLPKIGSIKESLNLSISVNSKMAEERLRELISSSPYYDDNKGSTANFLEVLNYLIEDDHKEFSQFKEIVNKLEQAETLNSLDFNTLEKI